MQVFSKECIKIQIVRIRPFGADRAFRSKSSDLLMQILWAFRCNPLRGGSSEPGYGIATGNCVGA
jgi:hypothetical protein